MRRAGGSASPARSSGACAAAPSRARPPALPPASASSASAGGHDALFGELQHRLVQHPRLAHPVPENERDRRARARGRRRRRSRPPCRRAPGSSWTKSPTESNSRSSPRPSIWTRLPCLPTVMPCRPDCRLRRRRRRPRRRRNPPAVVRAFAAASRLAFLDDLDLPVRRAVLVTVTLLDAEGRDLAAAAGGDLGSCAWTGGVRGTSANGERRPAKRRPEDEAAASRGDGGSAGRTVDSCELR